ncbi:hypothetical protein LTR78_000670 [Recurvomyces mirabilis]|uniref:thioredoxin-dependent peroxiredoxin n=1 Tax=Recurvomyces mirabilis TaxID=574656 RepID=A0AAE0WXP5_9PEZI|nr:hypothetical protein LTR78_000670 [Recurvomyces mirabilis]KAK5162324.1 hypothetical protein LTS14_000671 [Recurvomyces mirabilis]
MALATQLQNTLDGFSQKAPPHIRNPINQTRSDHAASFDPKSAIQQGAKLPSFSLSNAHGKNVTSDSLLSKGPILITFYRGGWCPFCSLALRDLQKHHDEFKAKGVTLVAISPLLPDESLSTVEKNELKFVVLSDVHNDFARQLGIVWKQPDSLRPAFKDLGHDLKTWNGDDSFEVPIPATLLVDRKGTVRNLYLDTDYTKRFETKEALKWVDAL